MEFNAFLLTLARVNLKPGVSLQPFVVAAIFNYFAQLRRCKRWYLHILQKRRNSPNFVESRMHPGWRGGMTLITWNSRRTNPTHTCTLSTDPVSVCLWQHSQETMTTLKRDSDNFSKEQWPRPHGKVTISPLNTDNFHMEQWRSIHVESLLPMLPTRQRSKHSLTFFRWHLNNLFSAVWRLATLKTQTANHFLLALNT